MVVKVYTTIYEVQSIKYQIQKGLFQLFFPIRNCCTLAAALVSSVGGYISDTDLFLLYKE